MRRKFIKPLSFILEFLLIIVTVFYFHGQYQGKKDVSSQPNVTQISENLVRKPAVAGQFYPAEKSELAPTIEQFLSNAKKKITSKVRILFVPHAGLNYSGQTAAWGFSQLKSDDYSRVIILSSNHQHPTSKASVYPKGSWQTPLGETQVDEDFALLMVDEKTNIISDADLFSGDHTIEVELIFLQSVLNDFKIVPILLGQINDQTVESLANRLYQMTDEKTLIVVSTDLSHYPNWEDAKEVDRKTINAILTGKKDAYNSMISKIDLRDYQNLQTLACGDYAIQVALKTAELLGISDFDEIDYSNSGDVSSDKSRVVGYAALAAYKDELPSSQLDPSTKQEALKIARETLESYLTKKEIPKIIPQNRYLYQPLGVFVTLERNHQLRGCIGHFEPKDPLYKVIQSTTVDAAINDRRFKPVIASELEDIEIEISIMNPKIPEDNWEDIELGKHGVVIQKGTRSGTFLPQVATDTGWSKEEFLGELCSQKAGLPRDCFKDPAVSIFTFEANVFSE